MDLEQIKKSILEIRGKKVMLDMHLAKIYDGRNIDRFPEDFMFELTEN